MYEKDKKQLDKAVITYVLHLLHVSESMKNDTTTSVALLHNIIEDNDMTFVQLSYLIFSQEVIDALKCLTHDFDVEYSDYIKKLLIIMLLPLLNLRVYNIIVI